MYGREVKWKINLFANMLGDMHCNFDGSFGDRSNKLLDGMTYCRSYDMLQLRIHLKMALFNYNSPKKFTSFNLMSISNETYSITTAYGNQ